MDAPTLTAAQEGMDPNSLNGRVDAIREAFYAAYRTTDGMGPYCSEVYDDHVIAEEAGQHYRYPHSLIEGKISFGPREKVKLNVSYTTEAVEEAAAEAGTGTVTVISEVVNPSSSLLESLDEGQGWVWRVTMVRPGISGNRRRYRAEVLAEAAQLYEGAKAYDGHRDDATRKSSPISGIVGYHENVSIGSAGELQSDFHISESAPHIRSLFLTAWKKKRADLIGFSHDVAALTEAIEVGGARVADVRKITGVNSVDVVADPAAGGTIERLVASRQEDTVDETTTDTSATGGEATTEAQAASAAAAAGATTTLTPVASLVEAGSVFHSMVIEAAITRDGALLPEEAKKSLRESLAQVTDEKAIVSRIKETSDIWAAALAARPSALPGQGGAISVGQEDRDKLQKGLDAMLMGVPQIDGVRAFRGVKEAYSAFTGRHPYSLGDEDFNRFLLAESIGCVPHQGVRLTESMTTASWTEALGDSITRRLIAEYNLPSLSSWRLIASEIGTINDFRTNRRVRVGGYDTLPVVAEAGAYTALTSPTDEEATYGITKKGGTEDYTLEMVANDDLSALRRIPVNMGRAAALTLYRAVWITTIAGNANIYDGTALFTVGHNNENATTPLAEAGITTLRTAMVQQTRLGETSGFIGLMPKYLVVPSELYVPAFKLAESAQAVVGAAESATTPNPHKGLSVIEVPLFTDVNDWYLVADPATTPTMEVGFYQGRQDPELLIQDQPAVGAVFTNDKFTWKIRHIWGLAILDFRGFQRATNV